MSLRICSVSPFSILFSNILMLRKRRPPWASHNVCLIRIKNRGSLPGQRYKDEGLHPHVLPIIRTVGNILFFQQDNASIPAIWQGNVLKLIMAYPLTGLPRPDPSPIDHPWDSLGWWVYYRIPNTSWLNNGNVFHKEWVGCSSRLLLSMF